MDAHVVTPELARAVLKVVSNAVHWVELTLEATPLVKEAVNV